MEWSQSTADPDVVFAMLDPCLFEPDYSFEMADPDAAALGLGSPEEAIIRVILTLRESAAAITANLMAPIVLNPLTRLGWQVVLQDSDLSLRSPVLDGLQAQHAEAPAAAEVSVDATDGCAGNAGGVTAHRRHRVSRGRVGRLFGGRPRSLRLESYEGKEAQVLILTRKAEQGSIIDGRITVRVLAVDGERVKIGIDAPSTVGVLREELVQQIAGANREAAQPGQGGQLARRLRSLDGLDGPLPGAAGPSGGRAIRRSRALQAPRFDHRGAVAFVRSLRTLHTVYT